MIISITWLSKKGEGRRGLKMRVLMVKDYMKPKSVCKDTLVNIVHRQQKQMLVEM